MLTLQDGMRLSTVQNIFNQAFPYLKLEFFKYRDTAYGGGTRQDRVKPDGALYDQTTGPGGSGVRIEDTMSVLAVVQLFRERYGLSAQVLRKAGKTWLETSFTNDWSLRKQNDQGQELSTFRA